MVVCCGPVAEWIMHRPPEPETVGSNPTGPALLLGRDKRFRWGDFISVRSVWVLDVGFHGFVEPVFRGMVGVFDWNRIREETFSGSFR